MVKAIVGANWGDEGKGKITDMLAGEADIVIRSYGATISLYTCSVSSSSAELISGL